MEEVFFYVNLAKSGVYNFNSTAIVLRKLTSSPSRDEGNTHQYDGVALQGGECVHHDDEDKDEHKDKEGQDVAKHDPAVERKCIDDDIVEQDSNEGSEDVDKADIKDNGGAREDCLEEINSSDEAVVREQEPHP